MFFLTPRHVKQGRALIKDAQKLLAYKRDLWSDDDVAEFEAAIYQLKSAVKIGSKPPIEDAALCLNQLAETNVKPVANAAWRENCEVFLVAIVIALGVRTYFLQPFTIPTGSMQPTLNGLIGYKTSEAPPNILVRLFQKAWFGRTWINVVAQTDNVVIQVRETKKLGFFTRTELRGERESYSIACPKRTLEDHLLEPLRPFKAGDVIARGYYDTGDHVFVDKFTYHFRKPKRGEVFVFNTQNIATRENVNSLMQGSSQFYIKRLAALPYDLVQIRPPELLLNGARAEEEAFQKVMSDQGGHRGYSNESESPPNADGRTSRSPMRILGAPDETVRIPARNYFALGDNSFRSSDSRDWGAVPQKNIMGRGVLVYWPFSPHWGRIR